MRTWTTSRTGRLTIKPPVSRFYKSSSNSNSNSSSSSNSSNSRLSSNDFWIGGRRCTVLRTITRNCFNPFPSPFTSSLVPPPPPPPPTRHPVDVFDNDAYTLAFPGRCNDRIYFISEMYLDRNSLELAKFDFYETQRCHDKLIGLRFSHVK